MITLILRALAAALALFSAPSAAAPALFAVSDDDTTIYLFGTIHALHDLDEGGWFGDKVREAFGLADELVVETLLPDGTGPLPTIDPAPAPLPSLLDPEDIALLRQAAGKRFDKFDPWVAWVVLEGEASARAGYSMEQGVDAVLVSAAALRGMPVIGLETADEQIAVLKSLPMADQLSLLRRGLHDPSQIMGELRVAVEHWRRGDAEAAAAAFNARFSPAAHERLNVLRNTAWAEWIRKRLERPGTVFVAVGAAHLGGFDSVQAQLAAKGVAVSRVADAD